MNICISTSWAVAQWTGRRANVCSLRSFPYIPFPLSDNTVRMKPRILLVDDNQQNVELLEAYLLKVDCDTEIAVDGQDALTKTAEFHPDLILLDVMMPKLNGFEVCQKLKSNPETAGIMILMVTALGELGDIERAVKAGCDDFLSKPVNQLELLKRIDNLLKLRTVTDELERLKQYIDSMEERR